VSSVLVAKNQCAIRLHDGDFNRMLMWLQDESVEAASSQQPAASHTVGSWYGGRRVGHVATCVARYKTQSGSGLNNQCTSG
jgi:hypothetical protein